MSKRSDAKKARRKKRQAARGPTWPVEETELDLAAFDEELTSRGWEFDVDHATDELATWFYPPSGAVVDDESREPVTRIWLTDAEDIHVILVGAGEDGVDYVFDVESLFDHLETVEAHRIDSAEPSFDD